MHTTELDLIDRWLALRYRWRFAWFENCGFVGEYIPTGAHCWRFGFSHKTNFEEAIDEAERIEATAL